ncbi:hypothetical protein DFH06DRAFT_529718 [Mycena polygramma]|nr:hypothetical protein DFH06DRAFT_529718 [Mycena polygramma]
MSVYSRKLGQNELSYFLPSRACGLNDMFMRVTFRAPPALVTPFRLCVAWAILRLRDSLLACKVDMAPGEYDDARFIYIPPSSPKHALEEAAQTFAFHDTETDDDLERDYLTGPRHLSAQCLSRMDVARQRRLSNGLAEYSLVFTSLHAITDGTSVDGSTVLHIIGGPATPGGPPRSDAELLNILETEWSQRWAVPRLSQGSFEAVTPPTEARLPKPRSRFQAAALKIDYANLQRRAIGAHAFPRIPSQAIKQTSVEVRFTRAQTAVLQARCRSEQVTLQNTVFVLCNFAWMRTAQNYPEINAPKTLPMLFYTAINLRQHLERISPLTSDMTLALGFGNIVLSAFMPSSVDPHALFWLRARSVQSQMRKQTQSPLLLQRSKLASAERSHRAKAFAKQDDEADGTLPPSPQTKKAPAPASTPGTVNVPSVALLGVSHLGDFTPRYPPERHPAVEFLDFTGHSRKAKGGILLFTRRTRGRFAMWLDYDAAAFPPGLIEEFWGNLVGGADEFLLKETRARCKL